MSKAQKSKTFWDIIFETIREANEPLSATEIWEKAKEFNITDGFNTDGKTPWASIAAYCYTDIREYGIKSRIIKAGKRPVRFFLRELTKTNDIENLVDKKNNQEALEPSRFKYKERDLHPLVVAFLSANQNFKSFTKTIFHEGSVKGEKGQNEWLHPDLVSVYFPFEDFSAETKEIQDYLKISSIKLFSFELKRELTFSTLRQSFFQAVSNSSWANEGYLIAASINEDPEFREELRRLNNAFGVGVIELSVENAHESTILFPSRINPEIDWDTVDRLVADNPDFKEFIKSIAEDCKLGKVKSDYDEILSPDRLNLLVEKWTEPKNG